MPYDVVYPEGGKFGIYEQLGTKEKFWVKRGAEDWLLKFGRSGSGETGRKKLLASWREHVRHSLCTL